MAKRTFELQSRNLFGGPDSKNFSELFDFSAQVDFNDDGVEGTTFIIELLSDYFRWKESADYVTNQQYMGNLSASDRVKIRRNIQAAMQVGFYGSIYKYTITKTVPSDGFFNWFGCQLTALPLNVDQEFISTLNTIESAL